LFFSLFLVFVALVAAAIVIRRKVNEPGNAFGLWFERNMRPRMVVAAKVVAYLTLVAWFLIYLVAPKEERGSFGDLMQDFRQAVGLEGGLEGKKTPAPPSASPLSAPPAIPSSTSSSTSSSTGAPFRILGPKETSKQVPGRR
jgi:hypothetical protein